MDVAEWRKRLTENFSQRGVVGGEFSFVLDAERQFALKVSATFHGQEVLTDAFQGFYVETIRAVVQLARENGWPASAPYYGSIVTQFVCLFRSYRACQTLLQRGYPMAGYALLRDLKDSSCFLAGIAHNITTFSRLWGHDATGADEAAVERQRLANCKKEQNRVMRRILREDSGLDPATTAELKSWEALFHLELHGARLSQAVALGDWLKTGQFPPLGPDLRANELALYMNRAAEIGWMLTRLLPYLQPAAGAFGGDWHRRHAILDDSFRFMQEDLSSIGKPIGVAFVTFMEQKFRFGPTSCYREADGTAP